MPTERRALQKKLKPLVRELVRDEKEDKPDGFEYSAHDIPVNKPYNEIVKILQDKFIGTEKYRQKAARDWMGKNIKRDRKAYDKKHPNNYNPCVERDCDFHNATSANISIRNILQTITDNNHNHIQHPSLIQHCPHTQHSPHIHSHPNKKISSHNNITLYSPSHTVSNIPEIASYPSHILPNTAYPCSNIAKYPSYNVPNITTHQSSHNVLNTATYPSSNNVPIATYQPLHNFLKYNKNNQGSFLSLLHSPIMSPSPRLSTHDCNDFGIPFNQRKRKFNTTESTQLQVKKKIKLETSASSDVRQNKESMYKRKFTEMKQIAKNLYNEAISGEKPRWELIECISKGSMLRDSKLHSLKTQLNSCFPYNSYTVEATDKWKGNNKIEKCVKAFLELNGEYKTNASTEIDGKCMKISDIIEKYKIVKHSRIPQLNGENGIMASVDIAENVCFGQYIGSEIEQVLFGKIFDGTADEYEHNVYAFDQKIDEFELQKLGVNKSKWFVIDPKIGGWEKDELLLLFVNDCRCDIGKNEQTKEDDKFFNVECVGLKVNGWPQTYLISKRKIRKGEELMTFYGSDFSNAITMKLQSQQQKIARKKRIDSKILKGLKL